MTDDEDRGRSDQPRPARMLMLLALAGAVSIAGLYAVAEATPTAAERAEERAHFEAYCHAVYGADADVYRASDAVSLEHTGLHCESERGTIHRTQISGDV